MSGDHRGFGQAQEINRARNVVGRQHRPRGCPMSEICEQLFAIRKILQRIGVDHAGTHGIHTYMPGAQLLRERAWLKVQGWEADPDAIPAIETLLAPVHAA